MGLWYDASGMGWCHYDKGGCDNKSNGYGGCR